MKKYKVSKDIMDELLEWQSVVNDGRCYDYLPIDFSVDELTYKWLSEANNMDEQHDRLIALINFAYGRDVFEVEKPKKWVVRSKERPYDSSYRFVALYDDDASITTDLARAYTAHSVYGVCLAFKFGSKEEAEKWTNPLMEVVEVENDDI